MTATEESLPWIIVSPNSDWEGRDPIIIGPFATRQEAENFAASYGPLRDPVTDDNPNGALVTTMETPEWVIQGRRVEAEMAAFRKPAS
jgi:hypothetical protein